MDGLTPKWGTFSPGNGSNSDAPHQPGKRDKPKRDAPFSLRLTFEEKQKLCEMAGRDSISAYIKARLFDADAPVKQARGLNPVKDQKALAQLLGMLGSSRIAKNLDELAESARVGALPLDGDTEKLIRRACDDIRIMRRFLLAALGIYDPAKEPLVCESCRSAFSRAVSHNSDRPLDQAPPRDREP